MKKTVQIALLIMVWSLIFIFYGNSPALSKASDPIVLKQSIYSPAGHMRTADAKEITSPIVSAPYKKDKMTSVYESAAENIINETGITKGYCLVLGCGNGRLPYELAKRTELKLSVLIPAGKMSGRRKDTGSNRTVR